MTFIKKAITAEGTFVSYGPNGVNPAFNGITFDTTEFESAQSTTKEKQKAQYSVAIDSNANEVEIDLSQPLSSTDYLDGFEISITLLETTPTNGMRFLAGGIFNLDSDYVVTTPENTITLKYFEGVGQFKIV